MLSSLHVSDNPRASKLVSELGFRTCEFLKLRSVLVRIKLLGLSLCYEEVIPPSSGSSIGEFEFKSGLAEPEH